MSEDVDYLECDHCGGAAINADADGLFGDGDGDSCITCGYPGHVVCDSETPPQWYPSDEGGNYCNDFSCKECGENLRIESKDDRQVAETWKSRALAAEARVKELEDRFAEMKADSRYPRCLGEHTWIRTGGGPKFCSVCGRVKTP